MVHVHMWCGACVNVCWEGVVHVYMCWEGAVHV